MKLLIISDSHGHISNLKHVLGFAKHYKVDAVIHTGDWNTLESVDEVLSFGIPLYSVLGNADINPQIANRLRTTAKKFSESYLELTLGGRKIGITHRPSDLAKYFENKKLDIIFCGHRHSKDESLVGGIKVVRAGAIIKGNNFAIYDTVTNKIEFVSDEEN